MQVITKQPADWTPADIAAFWDWQSKYAAAHHQYFTASMAPGIVRLLKKQGLLNGKLLDYGCGAGHLLELLGKENKTESYGIDFSADSINETIKRTKNFSNIHPPLLLNDLPTPFNNDEFDTITLIETIEHLQDESLHKTLEELRRILKPGGKILITTPFNEDLGAHYNFCPFCRSAFHHMQHMQSFTVKGLEELLAAHGFAVELCINTNIEKYKLGPTKFFIKRKLVAMAERSGLKEPTAKTPNLIAIVTKV